MKAYSRAFQVRGILAISLDPAAFQRSTLFSFRDFNCNHYEFVEIVRYVVGVYPK